MELVNSEEYVVVISVLKEEDVDVRLDSGARRAMEVLFEERDVEAIKDVLDGAEKGQLRMYPHKVWVPTSPIRYLK